MVLRMARPTTRPNSTVLLYRKRVPADILAKHRGQRITLSVPDGSTASDATVNVKIAETIKVSLRTREPAIAKLKRNASGDYAPDPMAARFPEWKPADQPNGNAAVSITSLLDGWKVEAKARNLADSTFADYESRIKLFTRWLGHDDARRVTSDDVLRYKDHRLKVVSLKTVKDSDLSTLKAIFGFGVRNRKIAANPAEGVTVPRAKRIRERDPDFSKDEIKAILNLARNYTPSAPSELQTTVAAKRWVPWLCAYTGARVGEMVQLRKRDVAETEAGWFLTITPEALKVKGGQLRYAPTRAHCRQAHGLVRHVDLVLSDLDGIESALLGRSLRCFASFNVGLTVPFDAGEIEAREVADFSHHRIAGRFANAALSHENSHGAEFLARLPRSVGSLLFGHAVDFALLSVNLVVLSLCLHRGLLRLDRCGFSFGCRWGWRWVEKHDKKNGGSTGGRARPGAVSRTGRAGSTSNATTTGGRGVTEWRARLSPAGVSLAEGGKVRSCLAEGAKSWTASSLAEGRRPWPVLSGRGTKNSSGGSVWQRVQNLGSRFLWRRIRKQSGRSPVRGGESWSVLPLRGGKWGAFSLPEGGRTGPLTVKYWNR